MHSLVLINLTITFISILIGDRPINVSYVIDSLDPKEAPSTGIPGKCYAV